jgi:hypothetical protein
MSKNVVVRIISTNASVTDIPLVSGRAVRAQVPAGAKLQFLMAETGLAPEKLTAKRVGNDLHITVEEGGDQSQQVILESYYDGSERALLGLAENGGVYNYVPLLNDAAFGVNGLVAEQSVAYVLGEMSALSGAAVGVLAINPLLALAGVGGVAAAIPRGSDEVTASTPAAPVLGAVNDNVDPVRGSIPAGGSTNDSTPTFSGGPGSAEAGAIVKLKDGAGNVIGSTTVGTDGSWSVTPTNPLPQGSQALTLTQTSTAGRESPAQSFPITVDTTAPTAPVLGAVNDNVDPVQGSIPSGGSTNDSTPTFSGGPGSAEAGAIVKLKDGAGNVIGSTTVGTDGSWSVTPANPLPQGNQNLALTQTDKSGNESPAATFPITVDTSAPAKPSAPTSYNDNVGAIQNPNSTAGTTDDATPGINIGTVPAGTTPSLYVDGVKVPATYDATTGTLTPNAPLPEGAKSISYTLTDPAGNESARSDPLTLTVDTSAPAKPGAPTGYNDNVGPVIDPNSNAPVTNDATPGIKIPALPSGTTPKLYVDGVPVDATYDAATGTLTPNAPLGEGPKVITYTLSDAAGNESPKSDPINLTVDTIAPGSPAAAASYNDNVGAIQNANSTASSTDDTTPGLNIGALPADVSSVVLFVDGVATPATYNATAGTLTPNAPLTEGVHQLTFAYTDVAGNVGTQSAALQLTVDTVAPGAPATPTSYADNVGGVQSPNSTAATTDDTAPGINIGTVPAGTTPKLYVNGTEVPATYNPSTGTLTPNAPLAAGLNNITYSLSDAAGNESAKSGALPITVNTDGLPATPATPTSYVDNVAPVESTNSTAPATNDLTPGVRIGALPAGVQSAKLYVDGVAVPATYDAGTGTLTPNAPLTEGARVLTVSYVSTTGNEGNRSGPLNVTIDATAPAAPAAPTSYVDNVTPVTDNASTAAVTNDTTPGFKVGTLPAGTTPSLYVNGSKVPATYDAATGTLTPNAPLTEGLNNISYTVTDAAGNESPQSAALPITVDTTAPAAPATPTSYADNVGGVQNPNSTAALTDDATPGINIGTVPAGTTPKLYVNGTEVPATYNPSTGTLTPNAPLAAGLNNITYSLSDAAGNESAKSGALPITVNTDGLPATPATPTSYVDNVAPVESTNSTAPATNDLTPGVRIGALPAGVQSAKLYVDGVAVPATYDAGTGTLTPNAPLTEGARVLTVSYVSTTGNEGNRSGPLNVTIDAAAPAAPAAPTAYVDNVGAVVSDNSSAPATDDTTPGIKVPTGLSDTPSLYVDGVKVPSTYDAATGTLTPTTPLAAGAHAITYSLTDAAGNESPRSSPALNITVDTTGPTTTAAFTSISVDSGVSASDFITNDNDGLTVNGSISAALVAGEKVQISLDNGTTWVDASTQPTATGTTWSHNAATLTATNTMQTRVVDTAGNASTAASQLVTIDTTAPTAPAAPTSYADNVGNVQNPTSTAASTDDTTPGINVGTVPAGTTPSLYVDGVKVPSTYDAATGTLTPTTPLAAGAHAITYSLTDAAGNESPRSSPALNITVDTTGPTTTAAFTSISVDSGVSASDFITNDNDGLTVNGSISAALVAGEKVQISLDNGTTWVDASTQPTATGTTWSHNAATLTATNTMQTRVVDTAGNASTAASQLVTIDTTAPTAPAAPTSYADNVGNVQNPTSTAASTDDTTPGINVGTVPAGTTPSLYVDGVKVPSTYDAATGTLTPTTPLAAGAHAITYSLTDAAGNESPRSSPALNITVDTTGPTTTAAFTSISVDSGVSASDFITNDNDGLTVNGSISAALVAGEKVQISLDNGTTWVDASTQPTATGTTWSHNAATLTATNTMQTRVVDTAGNASTAASQLVTIDTTAPAVTASITNVLDNQAPVEGNVANGGATNDTSPQVQGTVSAALGAGERLEVLRNGVVVGAATVTGLSWTYADNGVSDGLQTYTVRVADAGGNLGALSASYAINVDSVAPTGTTILDLNTLSDNGTSNTDNVTSVSTPKIDGNITGVSAADVAEMNAGRITATMFIDQNNNGILDSGDVVVDSGIRITATGTTGTFSVTRALVDGTYNVKAFLVDAAGNQSIQPALLDNSASARLVIDTTTPGQGTSSTARAELGYMVRSIGDFNGDGYADFAVTAPSLLQGKATVNGETFVVYGNANGVPSINVNSITAAQGFKLTGRTGRGDGHAQSFVVSGMGDINGDGYDDMAVANHLGDGAIVVWGRAGSATPTIDISTMNNVSTTNGFHLFGSGSSWFGSTISGADVNNDGYSDILVGDQNGFNGNGTYYVIYGRAGAAATWSNLWVENNGQINLMNASGGNSGTALAPTAYSSGNTTRSADSDGDFANQVIVIGDVNGDGYSDYLISAPRADSGTGVEDSGAAYLVFGSQANLSAGGTYFDFNTLPAGRGVRIIGTEAFENLGGSGFPPDPVNPNAPGKGNVNTIYAQGQSFANIGDINGDGIQDFAIGSPYWGDAPSGSGDNAAQGRVYVMYGKPNSTWTDFSLSGLNGTNGFVLWNSIGGSAGAPVGGSLQNNGLGWSVSFGGDANADGIDDFIVSAPGEDINGVVDAGAAYLVFGKQGASPFTATTNLVDLVSTGGARKLTAPTPTAGSQFGSGVTLGDWNGDGIADITVGENQYSAVASDAGAFYIYASAVGNLTQSFTSGADVLAAGGTFAGFAPIVGGVDRISGGGGDDTITGIGNASDTGNNGLFDVAYGGQGNDTIAIVGLNFTRVDGGLGIDTLRVDSSTALTLNFANLGAKVRNFEVIDMGASASPVNGNHTIALRLVDVLNLTEEQSGSIFQRLTIRGDSADTVDLDVSKYSTNTTETIDGITYHVYSHSDLPASNVFDNVLIQSGILVI